MIQIERNKEKKQEMAYRIQIALLALLVCSGSVRAQKNIKAEKQKTVFAYAQLNLHGGWMGGSDDYRWDLANHGPANQVAVQLYGKNQRQLQKGFTRFISLNSWKVKVSTAFSKGYSDGSHTGSLQLKLHDIWLKLNTRWDRTSIKIGKSGLPYGHNPKFDPVSSFMGNVLKNDLGMTQDLGVFFSTPLSRNLDLQMAVTSGGWLNDPLMSYGNLLSRYNETSTTPVVTPIDLSFKGTWLITGRIGSPSFKKNEFGGLAAFGYLPSNFITNDMMYLNHIGAEWIFKYNERLKVGNQVTGGYAESRLQGGFYSMGFQTNIDLFLISRLIISFSNSVNLKEPVTVPSSETTGTGGKLNGNLSASITYAVTPHTRIRLNHYCGYSNQGAPDQGIYLQLVTGFGKR